MVKWFHVFYRAQEGNKRQARSRVMALVRARLLPHPNTLPCMDCGDTEKKREYDHYLGYGVTDHEKVQPVCKSCHVKREVARGTAHFKFLAPWCSNCGAKERRKHGRYCKDCHAALQRLSRLLKKAKDSTPEPS